MDIYEFFDTDVDKTLIDNLKNSKNKLDTSIDSKLFDVLNEIKQLQTSFIENLKNLTSAPGFPSSSQSDLNNMNTAYTSLTNVIPDKSDISKVLLPFDTSFDTFIKNLPPPPTPVVPTTPSSSLSGTTIALISIGLLLLFLAVLWGIFYYYNKPNIYSRDIPDISSHSNPLLRGTPDYKDVFYTPENKDVFYTPENKSSSKRA